MSKHNLQEIEERLRPGAAPEPPEDLLERIVADIPAHLAAANSERERLGSRRWRLAAASLVLVMGGSVLAYWVVRNAATPAELAERDARQEVGRDATGAPGAAAGRQTRAESTQQANTAPERDGQDGAEGPYKRRQDLLGKLRAQAGEPVAVFGEEAERELSGDDGGSRAREEKAPTSSVQESVVVAPESPQLADKLSAAQLDAAAQDESWSIPAESGVTADHRSNASGEGAALPSPTAAEPQRKAKTVPEPKIGLAAPPPPLARRVEAPKQWISEDRLEEQRRVATTAPPSTGGTAEPNDQPYGDMFFQGYGTNPFVDVEDDRFSTFGLDVDTGSYTVVRSYLERGQRPPQDAVRVEELVNYFDYRDAAPRRDDFSVTIDGAPSPTAPGPRYYLLRFGLKGREIAESDRKPVVLTFVIDVSGSMAREDRLGLVKQSLRLLLGELRRGDRVGLVVYGSRGEVLIEPTDDLWRVERTLDRLQPGGSTNAEEGLALGYEMADRTYRQGAVNRVILCSDGVANVGRTGPESILQRIRSEAGRGIELTTVGFGMGNYNDVLMEQLADQGDGAYAYVDDLGEARRLFVDDLAGTLETIAADAKVQVEFDPRTVSRYRLLGYENRDIADERFRDDSVDAGEIGAGHAVTALYEIKLAEDAPRRGRVATLHLRWMSKRTGRVEERSVSVDRNDLASSWREAAPALRLASVAAEFAEILKGSYWVKEASLGELYQRARTLQRDFGRDPAVGELVRLIGQVAGGGDYRRTDPDDGWE